MSIEDRRSLNKRNQQKALDRPGVQKYSKPKRDSVTGAYSVTRLDGGIVYGEKQYNSDEPVERVENGAFEGRQANESTFRRFGNDDGYMNGQVFTKEKPKEIPKPNLKFVLVKTVGGVTSYYVGGHQEKAIKLFDVTVNDLVDQIVIDNLGGSKFLITWYNAKAKKLLIYRETGLYKEFTVTGKSIQGEYTGGVSVAASRVFGNTFGDQTYVTYPYYRTVGFGCLIGNYWAGGDFSKQNNFPAIPRFFNWNGSGRYLIDGIKGYEEFYRDNGLSVNGLLVGGGYSSSYAVSQVYEAYQKTIPSAGFTGSGGLDIASNGSWNFASLIRIDSTKRRSLYVECKEDFYSGLEARLHYWDGANDYSTISFTENPDIGIYRGKAYVDYVVDQQGSNYLDFTAKGFTILKDTELRALKNKNIEINLIYLNQSFDVSGTKRVKVIVPDINKKEPETGGNYGTIVAASYR